MIVTSTHGSDMPSGTRTSYCPQKYCFHPYKSGFPGSQVPILRRRFSEGTWPVFQLAQRTDHSLPVEANRLLCTRLQVLKMVRLGKIDLKPLLEPPRSAKDGLVQAEVMLNNSYTSLMSYDSMRIRTRP